MKTPDPAQFTDLVNTYQLPLLRMCCLRLGDAELAKDAVQETFLKAYKALPSFRGECSLQSWLMRIAINTCRDMQRSWWHRHVNRNVTPEEMNAACEPVSDDAVAVSQAIAALPVKLREVVLLYYYQNMQLDDIARTLLISPSSVSGRLKRARNKLRIALKGVYFDE